MFPRQRERASQDKQCCGSEPLLDVKNLTELLAAQVFGEEAK